MKKIILLLMLCIKTLILCAQNENTFDTKLLSLTYPSSYKETEITNAPHMLIKIESNEAFFSISSWDYEIGLSFPDLG